MLLLEGRVAYVPSFSCHWFARIHTQYNSTVRNVVHSQYVVLGEERHEMAHRAVGTKKANKGIGENEP